ncbi:unnamed protein product [Amoebophrya sp. A120]|nr:unnamed protein product [Amoebophrya sp. A120]|eukprot:GSA120T00011250001.1
MGSSSSLLWPGSKSSTGLPIWCVCLDPYSEKRYLQQDASEDQHGGEVRQYLLFGMQVDAQSGRVDRVDVGCVGHQAGFRVGDILEGVLGFSSLQAYSEAIGRRDEATSEEPSRVVHFLRKGVPLELEIPGVG